jgi:hypothetical protein
MRSGRTSFLIILVILLSGTAAFAANPWFPYDSPDLTFDGRPWKVGFENAAEEGFIREFVLEGQTVENWSELVTVQLFLMDNKVKPETFSNRAKQLIQKTCPNCVWNELSRTSTSMIYEWSVRACKGQPDQSELARVIIGRDGVYVLHYAVKKVPMPASNRKFWLDSLGKVKIDPPTGAFSDPFLRSFSIPPNWQRTPNPQKGMYTFQTGKDPARSMNVVIRFLSVPKQTAMEWASDEAKAVEARGEHVLQQPKETAVGPFTYSVMRSQITVQGRKVHCDQYFLKPLAGLVLEVAAFGDPGVLEKEKDGLDGLLSNFKFD